MSSAIVIRPAGKKFENNAELRNMIFSYLRNINDADSSVAKIYGYPMGVWEFEDSMVDFSNVFRYVRDFTGLGTLQDISTWDVQHGIVFTSMFEGATSFQGNLSQWNVRNARAMGGMFANAIRYQPTQEDGSTLARWNIARCSDFSFMFDNATRFNDGGLSQWQPTNGLNFRGMFRKALRFNATLADWKIFRAIDVSSMFEGSAAFDQDLSQWDVDNVVTFEGMFNEASNFDQDLTNWQVGQAETLSKMFRRTNLNQDYCVWSEQLSNVTNTGRIFFGSDCEMQGNPNSIQNETTGSLLGPFCAECFDAEGELITSRAAGFGGMSSWTLAIVLHACWLRWLWR